VQSYYGGTLPPHPSRTLDRYGLVVVSALNTETESDIEGADDDFEILTENTPFIGVASQSKGKSIIAYYGIENPSKWVFTPLFRGMNPTNVIPGRRPVGNRPINR